MDFDFIVIGSGPAGYVAAIRSAQLGLKTAIVEKEKPGGVCLNVGCIPTKALIHKAQEFRSIGSLEKMGIAVDKSGFQFSKVTQFASGVSSKLSKGVLFLLKKSGVQWLSGEAKFLSDEKLRVENEAESLEFTSRFFLIATGSRPKDLPTLRIDEKKILSSTGILSLQELPRSLAIIGAGAIGVEFAYIFRCFGVDITLIEVLPQLLPLEDSEAAENLRKQYQKMGIRVLCRTKVLACVENSETVQLELQKPEGDTEKIVVEKVLLAVGRSINTENIGLENIPILTQKGFIPVNEFYQTTKPNICAAGDVVSRNGVNTPLLAHVASKEAIIAVNHLAGFPQNPLLDLHLIPSCIYCEPEVASFGYPERELIEKNIPFKKNVLPYRAIGKAATVEQNEGFFKVFTNPISGEIFGATIIGAQATELIHELMLAKQQHVPIEAIANMMHAHPTLSEGIMEVGRTALDWAIHV